MPSVKQRIMELIPQLPAEDVPAVQGALKASIQFKDVVAAAPSGEDLIDDWVIAGLISYMVKRGVLISRGAYHTLRHRKAYKTYLSKLPALMGYLTRIEQQTEIKTRHRPKLAYVCAAALADMLTDWGVFSPAAMLTQIDKIPQAMDRAYPGYMEAGLFKFLFAEMEVPK